MSKLLSNRWVHFGILFLILMTSVLLSDSHHELRKRLQYSVFDQYNRLLPREPTNQVVIIDLDEESIQKIGQWPWPRTIMSELVKGLNSMGAKVIAFDMVFAEPDRTSPSYLANRLGENVSEPLKNALVMLPNNDDVFAKTIKSAGNVVTGFTRARAEDTFRDPVLRRQIRIKKDDKKRFLNHLFMVSGIASNLPELSKAATGNGSFIALSGVDGIIRQVPPLINFSHDRVRLNGKIYPMLGLEALRVATDSRSFNTVKYNEKKGPFDTDYFLNVADTYDIPIDADGRVWVYYRDIQDDEYIPAWKVLESGNAQDLTSKIKDKIVFIGTSAEGLRDIRSTPLNIFIPGVELHVNFVEQVIQGKYLLRPDVIIGAEALFILFVGLAIILLAPFVGMGALVFISLITIGIMFYGSWLSYVQYGLLLDPVFASLSIIFMTFVSSLFSYLRSEMERQQVREAFGLYVSPDFMEELTSNPDKLKLGGEVKDLTVMFTDIRSFTTISESLSPEELIQLMNDFLTPMSDLVMNNRGTIDKYMGDAMMAFWNAPLDDPNHARHACLAALKMNDALTPINEKLKKQCEKEHRPYVPLLAGIGINTGLCSVGNMGSRQRFAYSVLGDAANLASRLEGQTKAYGTTILLGEETAKHVQDFALLELDLIQVMGKQEPARIYTIIGDEQKGESPAFKSWQAEHNEMLEAYRAGDFVAAENILLHAKERAHLDLIDYYVMMMTRIKDYQKQHPGDNWAGVHVATDK